MKKYITLVVLLVMSSSYGQMTIKKSTISTGGETTTVGSKRIIYTVVETAVQEQTQCAKHLSEGFISPFIISSVGIKDYIKLEGVNIFPNPTTNFVNILFKEEGNYEYHLFDMRGKELLTKKSTGIEKRLNLSNIASGIYMLAIINRSKKQAIILKINKL
jgi:hypothetical protein